MFFSDVPFGDVSGLPDPYTNGGMGFMPQQHHNHSMQQQQQQQPSIHEGDGVGQQQQLQQQQQQPNPHESGYSTPTSKNRRIIREIIV